MRIVCVYCTHENCLCLLYTCELSVFIVHMRIVCVYCTHYAALTTVVLFTNSNTTPNLSIPHTISASLYRTYI